MGKRKICKIVFVILSIFLCVAFYELFGICIAYKKQPEVSNTIKKETQNDSWNERRASIQAFSQMSQSCIFTVDVFKERYDFASDNFATIFGYNPIWIKTIRKQGDLQEERIHPDDRTQLIEHQIEHG